MSSLQEDKSPKKKGVSGDLRLSVTSADNWDMLIRYAKTNKEKLT